MAHKTLIGGTAYKVSGGKTLVSGTSYSIKGGKTLVGGTAYDVSFAAGYTPLFEAGTLTTSYNFITGANRAYIEMAAPPTVDFTRVNTICVDGVFYPVICRSTIDATSTMYTYNSTGSGSAYNVSEGNPFGAGFTIMTSNGETTFNFFSYAVGTYSVSLGYVG